MRIRPSVHGFYVKNYLFATVLAVLMFFAGLYMIFASGELMISLGLVVVSVLIVVLGVVHSHVNSKTSVLYISGDQLVYETGILSQHKMVAPVSRITDSAIKRTFFERIFGIADLQVNTSGTGEIEILANDFNYEEVEKLHEELYRLINKTQQMQPAKEAEQKKE